MIRKIRSALISFFSSFNIVHDDKAQAALLYWISFGKKCNFDHPKTFNEHITARKVTGNLERYNNYTDKYLVRDYVETHSNVKLNSLLGVWEKAEDIDFKSLPQKFVLKCNHGSGYNIIVRDKSKLDIAKTIKQLNRWLGIDYYSVGRERNYKGIKPKIICEKFLAEIDNQCPEYKVFCFYGIPRFVQVNFWKNNIRYSNFYSDKWEYLPVQYGFASDPSYSMSDCREDVLKEARNLSSCFDFVRVDLYVIKHSVIFSELTFGPGSGLIPFYPDSFDEKFGEFFNGGRQKNGE